MRTILSALLLIRHIQSTQVGHWGSTDNGYDAGGEDPICWEGASSGLTAAGNMIGNLAFAVAGDQGSGEYSTADDLKIKNPLVANFTVGRIGAQSSCPEGVDLRVQPPQEFSKEIPRTSRDYSYIISGAFDLNFLIPEGSRITSDRNKDEIGVHIVLCPLEDLGFCNPFERKNDLPNESILRRRVESPYVLINCEEDKEQSSSRIRNFTVKVPINVEQEGGYSLVASVLAFWAHENVSGIHHLVQITNMPFPRDRVVYFLNEPEVNLVTLSARITACILSGICASVLLFLLYHTIKHRKNQVLLLTQGKFLSAMLFAGLIAMVFAFSFEPTSINCCLTGPFVILPLHVMYAISAGRLWRINAVISPLLLMTLDKKEDTFNQRIVKGIQALVMCSRESKLRQQVTEQHLARAIFFFSLPQVAVQIAIVVLHPNAFSENANPDDTHITFECGEGLFRSGLEATSLVFLLIILMLVFTMASSSRDLPSLFNETQVLYQVTIISVLISGVALFVVYMVDSNPNVWYLICVFAVGALTVTTATKIVMPKLYRVWSGEVVVVSKLLADHNKLMRVGDGPSEVSTYTDFTVKKSTGCGGLATPATTLINSLNISKMEANEKFEEVPDESYGLREMLDDSNNLFDDSMESSKVESTFLKWPRTTQRTEQPKLSTVFSRKEVSPHSYNGLDGSAVPPASLSGADNLSASLRMPSVDEIISISEDQPPPRQLLLRMIDLQQQLSSMNKNILYGTQLEKQDWENLKMSTTKFSNLLNKNVKFTWELRAAWEREVTTGDILEEEDGYILPLKSPTKLETIEDEGNLSRCNSSASHDHLSCFRVGTRAENLNAVAASLRKNVEVRDRKYRTKTYKNCFIASEAVDFLVSSRIARSRADAVQIGKTLEKYLGFCEHVMQDHEFADDDLFFRFVGIHAFGNGALTNAIRAFDGSSSEASSVQHVPVSTDWKMNSYEKEQALAKIAIALKSNVIVKDRRYRLVAYPSCFVASEAVDYLVQCGVVETRNQAVETALLCNKSYSIFEHVTQDHEFRDDYLFFRFVDSMTQETDIIDRTIQSVDGQGKSPSLISELGSELGGSNNAMENKTDSPWKNLTDDELATIALNFMNEIEVGHRKYRVTLYEDCFIGSEAVDYLVGCGYALSRKDAVQLGRTLAGKFDLFNHVVSDHLLKDNHLLYRFTENCMLFVPGTSAEKSNSNESDRKKGGRIAVSTMNRERLENLNDIDLARIAMSLKRAVPIQDRRYHLVAFKKCFIGRQAVDYLVNSSMARSRKDATQLAIMIGIRFELFVHVTQEHGFEDGYRFYRFREGNQLFVKAICSLPSNSGHSDSPHSHLGASKHSPECSNHDLLHPSNNMNIEEVFEDSENSSCSFALPNDDDDDAMEAESSSMNAENDISVLPKNEGEHKCQSEDAPKSSKYVDETSDGLFV